MCGIKDIHFHIRSAVYKHFFYMSHLNKKGKHFILFMNKGNRVSPSFILLLIQIVDFLIVFLNSVMKYILQFLIVFFVQICFYAVISKTRNKE